MTDYEWEGRQELVRRAKKRGLWAVLMVVPFAVLAGVLPAVLMHHNAKPQHRQVRTFAGITVTVIILVVYAAAAIIAIRYARKRGRRLFQGRPLQGLPFRDQRRVGRAIRTATPSSDPLLANVEREIAQRLVRSNTKLIAIGVTVLALLYAAAAVSTPSFWWVRIILICMALLSPMLYWLYRRQMQRAHRYLIAAGDSDEAASR